MPRRSFLQVLLIVFVISFAFIQSLPDYRRLPADTQSVLPDYQQYMQNFVITQSHSSGNASHVLEAKTLKTRDNGQTELEGISLSMQKETVQTLIFARKGLVESDQSIYLMGDVRITRNNLETRRTILIETDKIYHKPSTGISETDSAVKLTTPEGIISAIGMTIDNENKQLELKQNVIGRYEAP